MSIFHLFSFNCPLSPCCWQPHTYQKVVAVGGYVWSCYVANGKAGTGMWAVFVYLYIYFNFFGGKDTGALAEGCDVSGLWICQVAVKQRIGGRERNEDRAKQRENRSWLDPERELNPQGSCDCVKSFFVTETFEFSGSIRWKLVTVLGFNVWMKVISIQKEKSSFCSGSLERTNKWSRTPPPCSLAGTWTQAQSRFYTHLVT